jgi:Na+-driven multidrug efflux pump
LSETGSEAMASPPPTSMQQPMVPPVAPYVPPPNYPPPAGVGPAVTDGKAAASLVFAILGLIFAIPLGLPGMIAGPIAYFLGKGARERIAASNGALTGAGAASAGRILGIITTAIGAIVTLVWLVILLNALNDVSSSGF